MQWKSVWFSELIVLRYQSVINLRFLASIPVGTSAGNRATEMDTGQLSTTQSNPPDVGPNPTQHMGRSYQ